MIPPFQALARVGEWSVRLAGLFVALGFHAAWLIQPLGWRLTTFHLLLTVLAIARPTIAVIVLAGLVPLTTSLGVVLRSPFRGQMLVLAMLWAVTTGLLMVRPQNGGRLRTSRPALLFAITAVASAFVAMAGDPLVIITYPTLRSLSTVVRAGDVFHWVRPWISVQYAILTSLALLLLVFIERTIRQRPATARWLIGSLLGGHGLAVTLSVGRLATPARDTQGASLLQLLAEVRFHSQYSDVNAAGSAFVIVLLAGIGLALSFRVPWQRALAWSAVGTVLVGLWLSGSRAALAATLVVLAARPLVSVLSRPGRRAVLGAVAGMVAVAALAGLLYALYPAARNVGLGVAFETRKIMVGTAFNAAASAPVFGIGIGRFYERSQEFGAIGLAPYMNAAYENAHNQFLQTLAELGGIGILGLLLLTFSALRGALQAEDQRLRTWAGWGVLGTLATWMLGHPLLVPEYAIVFWMALGIVAGLGSMPSDNRSARWFSMSVSALAAIILVTAPLRGQMAGRRANLEHLGVGLTPLLIDEQGVRYRAAADRFSLFVPSASSVVLPLRASHRRYGLARVDVLLRGRLINRVELPHTGWLYLRMFIPASESAFERVDFIVTIPGHTRDFTDELVHVGVMGATPTAKR